VFALGLQRHARKPARDSRSHGSSLPCRLAMTALSSATLLWNHPSIATRRMRLGSPLDRTLHLSNLLAARRSEILERWRQRISREHADKDLSHGELWDHLPLFFDEVLAALESTEGMDEEAAPQVTASTAHGTQRLRVGFDLLEVIREYEILTDCILDEIEAVGGSVSRRQFQRVQRLLNAGRTDAVSAYIDRRDMEIARDHAQHVAFITHELRTPLMNASLATAALRKKARPDDEWIVTLLTRNLGNLRELIDEVLIADRLTRKVELKREPLDLRAIIDQVVADSRIMAEQHQIGVSVAAPDALPYRGDLRLLRSAIGNIIGNAIKFTHEGQGVAVRAEQRPDCLVLEVEDHCGGLPDGNSEELFEPFVQRGEDRTGFGLGLAIVKQAVDAHDGRVLLRNVPGTGCVFILQLPLVKDG
jgi:signal transduction histidine kinase